MNSSNLKTNHDYLMVVPVQFYKNGENIFSVESAFAEHLKLLRSRIGSEYHRMLIVAPVISTERYRTIENSMSSIDSRKDNIYLQAAYPANCTRTKYVTNHLFPVALKLWKSVKKSQFVHSGPSQNIFRPFEILAILFSVILRRKSVFVVDIDRRNTARMLRATKAVSSKSYFLMRYIYDPLFSLQIRFAARFCTLCLLKGQSMVDRYKRGSNVKNFLDTAHKSEYILAEKGLDSKIKRLSNSNEPIKICYFGRITPYKGIKDMLDALASVSVRSDKSFHFTVIGDGEQREELVQYVHHLNLNKEVTFIEAVPYGPDLFKRLYQQNILLAAPLREDTPRSLFDGMAAGIVTIAYDTYYYRDNAPSGGVIVVPWRNIDAMALAIIECMKSRDKLIDMMIKARNFARLNTQDVWLEKRLHWIDEVSA